MHNIRFRGYSCGSLYKIPTLILLCLSFIACSEDEQNQQHQASTTENSIRFIAIGDVGTGSPEQYQVAQAMKRKCDQDGCDFVLMLGDNIYQSGVDSLNDVQFQSKFELPYANLNMPFYVALGNHDYGANGAGLQYTKSLFQVDYTGVSDKWTMPHHYYKFEEKNALFIALDTNAQMYHLDENQQHNVTQWINETRLDWIIAFGHHPYKSNGPHGNAGSYDGVPSFIPIAPGEGVKDFAEATWCGKADLYLSGHDHSRQLLDTTCQGTVLAVSGAGAKVTTLPGNNPSLYESATTGFLYIVIRDLTLTAQFISADGVLDFEYQLNK